MKKKIFISVLLLFVASLCFAQNFDNDMFPFVIPVGIKSKKEFNDFVIELRELFKERKRTGSVIYSIFDDSYKISKYEKNYVINAILNEYDVETGNVYVVMASSYPINYCYLVRIDKVHKSGKVDFTIKAIAMF